MRHLSPVCEATHIRIPWFSWWYLQPGFINWTWSSKIKAYLTLRLPELNRKGNRRKVTWVLAVPFLCILLCGAVEPGAAATCSRHLGSTCHYVLLAMTGSSFSEGKIKLSSMKLLIRYWVKAMRKHHTFSSNILFSFVPFLYRWTPPTHLLKAKTWTSLLLTYLMTSEKQPSATQNESSCVYSLSSCSFHLLNWYWNPSVMHNRNSEQMKHVLRSQKGQLNPYYKGVKYK